MIHALAFVLCTATGGAAQTGSCDPAPAAPQIRPPRIPALPVGRSQEVDALFAPWTARDGPGVAVLVTLRGEVMHIAGYGLADVTSRTPLTPATLFDLASLTKQFTGMAVVQLVRQGALSYDDTISHYLPAFARHAGAVTLRDLLGHTSGIPDYIALFRARGPAHNAFPRAEEGAAGVAEPRIPPMLETLAEQRLRFASGSAFEYSNSGYLLAAAVIEKVSGMSYPELVHDRIFAPAGMRSSIFSRSGSAERADRARSYTCTAGRWERQDYTPLENLHGASGIVSNLTDLGAWYSALDRGSIAPPDLAASATTTGYLASGEATDYGFGWVTASDAGLRRLAHGGWTKGFRHIALRFPEEQLTVVLLSNDAAFAPLRNEMAYRVARLWLPELPVPVPDAAAELSHLTGTYATDTGQRFSVLAAGATLSLQTPTGMAIRLHPLAVDSFFVEGIEEQRFRFVRDADGIGVRMIRHEYGLGSSVRTVTTARRR